MPAAHLTVPADDRPLVVSELLARYGAKAESVHRAVGTYVDGAGDLSTLLAARAELATTDALLEQVGWELAAPAEPMELVGDPEVVRLTLVGALGDALDALTAIAGSREAALDADAIRDGFRQAERLLAAIEELKP